MSEHVGNHFLNQLVRLQQGTELRARAGVVKAGLKRCLAQPQATPGNAIATMIKCRARHMRKAKANASDQMVARHTAAAQMHIGDIGRTKAEHAGDWFGRKSIGATLNQKGSRFALGLGQDQKQVGTVTKRDPALAPVDAPAVCICNRRRFYAAGIAADIGLGQTKGTDQLAAGQFWQPFLPLAIGAPL